MCGLIGYVGKNPNLDKLKIMAIYNDSRGGDGVGFVINDTIYKYNKTGQYDFQDVFEYPSINEEFTLESPSKEQVILMHSRKGSVGSIVGTDNNHPFELKSEGGDCLIGVHNGTIKNIKDLASKYGITDEELDKLGKTDSELLFYIINKTQSYEVLSYYEGGAALLWYNPENPKELFAFKGASDSAKSCGYNYTYWNSYSTPGPAEERPLYLVMTKNGTYFSSIKASLYAAGFPMESIKTVESNTVYTFRKGEVKNTVKIERQTPYYIPKQTKGFSTFSPKDDDTISIKNNLYYHEGFKMNGFYWIDEDDLSGYLIEELNDFVKNIEYYINSMFSDISNDTGYYLFYQGYLIKNLERNTLQRFAIEMTKYPNLYAFPNILSKFTANPVLNYQTLKVINLPKKSYEFEFPLVNKKVTVYEDGNIIPVPDRTEKFASARFIGTDSYSRSKWDDVSEGKDLLKGVVVIKNDLPMYFKCKNSKATNGHYHTYFKVDEEVEIEDMYEDYVEILTKDNKLKKFFSEEDAYKISSIKDARTIYVYDDNSMLRELTLDKSFRLIKSYTPYFEEEDFYDMDDPFYSSENPQVVNNYINKLNKTY
jgi:predicted glutamine amidotransferase